VVVYSLAAIPAVPQLIGSHPVLLELLTGSLPGQVAAGALARVGGTSLVLALAAGVLGVMMFDWVFWWAGRRWGRRGAVMLAGRGPRSAHWLERGEHAAEHWGWLWVIVAYYQPIPNPLVYALVGATGMRLRTFLICDVVGALLWTGMAVGLGFAIGHPAIDVAHAITRYSLLATVVLVVLVIGREAWRQRV
jgi:membrane protein DedA with SNARE-associated domain